ncbi:hypothetical protein, partial [Enterobacter hormaechei]|uniref:hypothetical protein n=1 Tax=Enterobacter hormaechei TaxID=158836 RepID=UPI00195418D6
MFAALGFGAAYMVIVSLYIGSTILTLCISPSSEKMGATDADAAMDPSSPWRDLSEGIVYIWNTPRLQAAMWV